MAFEPEEFLRVADDIASQDTSESSLRTAVGRAYYGAFLKARDRIGVAGRRNIHGRVIGELRRIDRAAGDQLDKLEELRIIADYHMDVADPLFSNWTSNWIKARSFADYIMRRI